ncbi:hypothetical protein EDC01DRAFT_294970 [Geopyxis carbonaria]|nr:hypothetical protein EDC01DRAFT_294970 [Geopyxis carbonaria]
MAAKLPYTVLSVFSSEGEGGNELAVVPKATDLTPAQKQAIAKTLGFAETVFLGEPVAGDGDNITTVSISIFGAATDSEIPFSGHPAAGAAWYLFGANTPAPPGSLVLEAMAGVVPVASKEGGIVCVSVPPGDFKVHAPHSIDELKTQQPALEGSGHYINSETPIVSMVKGMTFVMLEIASVEALAKMVPYPAQMPLPEGYLGAWAGSVIGVYAFVLEKDTVRARMFYGEGYEDAASGSAACALAGWLAGRGGRTRWVFTQGVEMGRKSEMDVSVDIDDEGDVAKVVIEGKATKVREGEVEVPKVE